MSFLCQSLFYVAFGVVISACHQALLTCWKKAYGASALNYGEEGGGIKSNVGKHIEKRCWGLT